ncbi:ribonucleoside-diphosphate reductase 2 subunit alpha [Salmonella enterica subsp. enterica]|uniref:Ribonucleoside-diphosphate reductase 2 subunit alpha n=1 Tax=Salmonella enterica I TaxID=59201 RepID=A0A379WP70_SALET|nr:ribonucleoside-diphosphate reductase 2 subunit alpha [Salmonella enterica subsp. enterica]
MKMLEDAFSYANQLGARQGAGAVYLHAHHPDILRFLDTKRENADEKIRIKTLSLGVVIPDITFRLAKENAQMALFSPMTYNDATANRLAISPLANGTMN